MGGLLGPSIFCRNSYFLTALVIISTLQKNQVLRVSAWQFNVVMNMLRGH